MRLIYNNNDDYNYNYNSIIIILLLINNKIAIYKYCKTFAMIKM